MTCAKRAYAEAAYAKKMHAERAYAPFQSPLVVNLFDVRAFNVGLLDVRPVSVPLGVNLFDVCAFNVGPLDVHPVSVPLGVNLFDVRAFNVGPLDVRPVSDPLRRRPLGCRPLECTLTGSWKTISHNWSYRAAAVHTHRPHPPPSFECPPKDNLPSARFCSHFQLVSRLYIAVLPLWAFVFTCTGRLLSL
jgi:hypothetical protein